jgi:type I pantothenate kinase
VGRGRPAGHLIVEGLNVLQTGRLPKDGKAIPVRVGLLRLLGLSRRRRKRAQELVRRPLLTLRGTAFRDPKSYFHRYSKLSDDEAVATAARSGTASIS